MESKTLEYKWNPNYRQGWCVCGPNCSQRWCVWKTSPYRTNFLISIRCYFRVFPRWKGRHLLVPLLVLPVPLMIWISRGEPMLCNYLNFKETPVWVFFNISESEDRQFWFFENKSEWKNHGYFQKKFLKYLWFSWKNWKKANNFSDQSFVFFFFPNFEELW